jgi:hypothetical protein
MTTIFSRRSVQVTVAAAVILLIAASVIVIKLSAPVVPSVIKTQLSFVVLYPKGNGFIVDHSSWKYDSSIKLLTYLVTYKNTGAKLTVSEQSSPPEFSEVPGTLDKLTGKLNTYTDFDSIQGHAYLTHPSELKGGQSAVMNAKGTLMFTKPDKSLPEDTWRQFFNSLQVVQ